MADPVARSDQVDVQLGAALRRLVRLVQVLIAGFAVVAISVAALLGLVVALIVGQVHDRDRRITELDEQIVEQDELLADAEQVIGQAVAGIQLQNQMLRDAGVTPPEIVLMPTDEEESP